MNSPAMSVLFIILVKIILAATRRLSTAVDQPRPGCKTTCGNLTNINFPFGMSEECYLDEYFLITCDTTFEPPKAFYQGGNFPVLSISHEDSTMRIQRPVSRICYDPSGNVFENKIIILDTYSSKFPISDSCNEFIGIGCETVALNQAKHTTSCKAVCDGVQSMVNGSCTGIGCCENKISKEMNNFSMGVYLLNRSRVIGFNPCSYVFLAEKGSYSFNSLDLWNMRGQDEFPVVLDWAVDELPCPDAVRNTSSYACRSSNSECVNSTNGPGYGCKCFPGFRGNPYLYHGCKDIDECEENPNICGDGSICSNSPPGNYSCSCKKGYHKDGGICRKKSQKSIWHIVSEGVSVGLSLLLLLVMGSLWIYLIVKKRKLIKQRERFFQKNGGFILRQQLSEQEDSVEKARIFTLEDLKRATNNYDESRIIGQGGYGTVYKGVLLNNREVAIKKSKISDQSQVEQFINEVVILSKINHVNVVKLIGCCLETEVPLLVYEFISNGTLYQHIHNKSHASSLSWEMRLKIAAESAGAIAYIQYAISTPIIHRDIKSTNILLDDSYGPKVSDFGASIFFPLNKTQLTTFVQGTYGYLDPEYFYSNQLTKKSDVYSFGVLLAELLTGKEAISFDRPDEDRNLAAYFVSSMKDDRLVEILDDNLVKEANIEQLREVAMLVKRCLRVKGKERPTMKEVATELEVIRVTNNNSWAATEFNTEE